MTKMASILLALVIVLGLMPAQAVFADEDDTEYTVTVVGGTADVATAKAGDTVTITANVAEAGHAFVQWWIVDGVDYAQADAFTTTFAMPKKDVTVTAVFKEIILPDLYDEAYTGTEIKPTFGFFDVTLDGVDLVFPNRYELSYKNNINVGTATVTLTFKDPETGEPDSRLGTKSATFQILPASLTITGVSASDKVYDSTTDATIDSSSATVSGLISGDDVSLTYTGIFGDANVGSDKQVTVTVTLSGEAAGNYEVTSINTSTASITKRALTITAIDQEYTYNGQTQGEGDTTYNDPAKIAEKVTVSGLQGSDALTSITLDGQGQNVDEYELVPSNATIGEATGNYDITYVPGKLTIKPDSYTVTYKVVNGTWADGTTADKTETVASGTSPLNAPTGMIASSGYTGGTWDIDPSTATITEATTFTYTFEAFSYNITGGANVSWTKGSSEGFMVTVKRSKDDASCFSHYVETLIDGKKADVSAKSGSTIITISAKTLENLSKGSHTITVKFDDGQAETTFTIADKPAEQKEQSNKNSDSKSPKTGDNNLTGLWAAIMGAAFILIVLVISAGRKHLKKQR